jgi:hypothetical protein
MVLDYGMESLAVLVSYGEPTRVLVRYNEPTMVLVCFGVPEPIPWSWSCMVTLTMDLDWYGKPTKVLV